jgi:hypothetical protein
MVARSRSCSICKYQSQFTVSFKKIGPSKLWLDMATKAVTFPLWLLFHESSRMVPSPKTTCSTCSQSYVNENRPCPKTVCLKEFNVLLLPRMGTEVTWLCQGQKAYSPQQFCMGDFPFLSKYYLYILLRLFTHLSCLTCWLARTVLAQLQETAQLQHADTLFLHTQIPLQTFWKSTV